jgi:hypothetical protein
MSQLAAIEELFRGFDMAADPILDDIAQNPMSNDAAAMQMGLALRLVSFSLGSDIKDYEQVSGEVASSLCAELTALRRHIRHGVPQ